MGDPGVNLPVPTVHRHPAVKWMLMVAILAVAGLSLPHSAVAAQPAVSAPTGATSGGSFTGPFSFATYIYCTNGVTFSSSYTSSLDGTNNFTFYGAPDGSLLVSINGGGKQLLSSCGDPFASPQSAVASYNVTKGAPPPTPTPTPTPTPSPTPTPTGGGGSSGGTSGGTNGGTSGGTGNGSASAGTGHASSGAASSGATPTPQADAAVTSAPAGDVAAPASHLSPSPAASPATATTPSRQAASQDAPGLVSWLVFVALAAGAAVGVWWLRAANRRQRLSLAWSSFALRVEPFIFRLKLALRHHGRSTPRRRGLSSHHYSGRVLAHHHTSYPALAFLLILTTVAVGALSLGTRAADSSLSLSVTGPPPTTGATITTPSDGEDFDHNIITIAGVCPSGLRVEISRNSTFAGSTLCDTTGQFSLPISLVDGSNVLLAADYDGAGQPGPATPYVSVTYTAPPAPSPTPTPSATPRPSGAPTPRPLTTTAPAKSSTGAKTTTSPVASLIIDADHHYYAGLTAGTILNWPLRLSGGTPPYTLDVDWGDEQTSHLTASAAGLITPSHTYATPGTYHITFALTDKRGGKAILRVLAIVNGAAPVVGPTSGRDDGGSLVYIWPVLVGTMMVVLSFWLGERDHMARFRRATAALTS